MARQLPASVSGQGLQTPGFGIYPPTSTNFNTWAIWGKPNGWSDGDTTGRYLLYFSGSSDNSIITSGGSGARWVFQGGTTLNFVTPVWQDGVWTHIAVNWDNTGGAGAMIAKMYVNGVLNASTTTGTYGTYSTGTYSSIGSDYQPLNQFQGALADFGQWNVVLSAAEILALANGARPGQIRQQNLACWYPLGGTASPEIDLAPTNVSGGHHNLNVSGSVPLALDPPFTGITPLWPQAPQFTPPLNLMGQAIIQM